MSGRAQAQHWSLFVHCTAHFVFIALVAAVFIDGCVLHPCSLFGHSSLIALVVTQSVLQSAANGHLITLEAIASVLAAVCPVSRAAGNCPPRICTVHTVCRPTLHKRTTPCKMPRLAAFLREPTAVVVVTASIVQCEDSSSANSAKQTDRRCGAVVGWLEPEQGLDRERVGQLFIKCGLSVTSARHKVGGVATGGRRLSQRLQ